MNRPKAEQGSLTLMALLVLVALAVLGGSMGWVNLRSIDLATEWLNQPTFAYRPMGALLVLGQRVARDQMGKECALPPTPHFRLEMRPQWGEVEGTFHPMEANGARPVTITGRQGDRSQTLSCRIYCSANCPTGGEIPEQCKIESNRGFIPYMTCP